MFRSCCPKKKKKPFEQVFDQAEKQIKTDLNLFTIVQTIMKIKSTLTVLIANDEDKFYKIQNHYVRNATINITDGKEAQTKYQAFLNRDEREEMTFQKQI